MYSTMRQREYINDIERNLNITYNGSLNRNDASKFIAEFADANDKYNIDNRVSLFPTGNQLRSIKEIEERTNHKYNGKNLCDASDFINEYY